MDDKLFDNNYNIENIKNNSVNTIATNCLALTVRKEYRLTITKHFFKKSIKLSIRVALSLLSLNFLNLFI